MAFFAGIHISGSASFNPNQMWGSGWKKKRAMQVCLWLSGLFPVGCWRWLIWGSSHERYFIFGPFGAPYSRDCILSGYWISHVINTVFHQSTLTQNSLDGTKLGRWHKIRLMAQNSVDDKTRSTKKTENSVDGTKLKARSVQKKEEEIIKTSSKVFGRRCRYRASSVDATK